jgi:Subtilase family
MGADSFSPVFPKNRKPAPMKIFRFFVLAIAATCSLEAQTQEDFDTAIAHFPKPEDPVVLPTDEEMAQAIKKSRENSLRMLEWDEDGWDDLWVHLQKARHKDYQFDPKDKAKDTDGDGLSDYEEMLIHRDANFAEPIYTKEELIAQAREGRRLAIEAEKNAVIRAFKRREELAPLIIPPLTTDDGAPATTEAVEAEGKQKLAALAEENVAADVAKRQRADAFALRNNIDKDVLEADGRVSSLVDVVDGVPQFYTTNNSVSADTISTDEVRSGGSLGLALNGSGTTIGIWDGGDVYSSHNEFTTGGQRITDKDGASPLGVQFHPTHVSGTMMAKGVVASARGMASEAQLHAHDWNSDLAEMTTAASADNLRLSNHSYGTKQGWDSITAGGVTYWAWYGDTAVSNTEDYKFGFYSDVSQGADILAYSAPNYLTVWSATNEREAGTIANGPTTQPVNHYAFNSSTGLFQWTTGVTRPVDGAGVGYDLLMNQGVSKNVMTVAAVQDIVGGWSSAPGVSAAAFSSFGPPDDGRIKPDISANGVGLYSTWNTGTSAYDTISGTSMAAPSVTGSLDLLIQHYKNLFGTSATFRAATLKGLAIHTADEAGPATGPDYSYGWGLMNTKKAAELISLHADSGTALRNIKQPILSDDDFIEFPVRATGGTPLKVTICWTDPAGTVQAKAVDANIAALVNDLDLRVTNGGSTYYPWKLNPASPANAGDNDRDNVERVDITSPTAGQEFTVKVTHKGILKNSAGATASQAVSIIVSGVQPDPEPEFKCTDVSRVGVNTYSVTWNSVVGATYSLATSDDLVTWTDLPGDYVATKITTVGEVSNTVGEPRRFWRVKRH